MATKIMDTNLDMQGGIIENVKVDKIIINEYPTDPTGTIGGCMIYFNSTDKKIHFYNGTNWEILGTGQAIWGQITGILTNQTDLNNKLIELANSINQKSKVEINTVFATGTKVATIKINSVPTELFIPKVYAPDTAPPGTFDYFVKYDKANDKAIWVAMDGLCIFKGTVVNYTDLPATGKLGETWNVQNAFTYLGVQYDGGTNVMWEGSGWIPSVGKKTTVAWNEIITSGKKIATITIDGVATDVFCNASEVSMTPVLSSGVKLAEFVIDGATKAIYCPNIPTIKLNDVTTLTPTIFAPEDKPAYPIGHTYIPYYDAEHSKADWMTIDGVSVFKGTVLNYTDLPNPGYNGWIFNVQNPFDISGTHYDGGTNVMWEGVSWVPFGNKTASEVVWQQIASGGSEIAKITINGVTTTIVNGMNTSMMRYKGTVTDWSQLPTTGMRNGDMYVNSVTNTSRIWNADNNNWDELGSVTIEVDSALSDTSVNPVQNKVIKAEIDKLVKKVFTLNNITYGEYDLGTAEHLSYTIIGADGNVIFADCSRSGTKLIVKATPGISGRLYVG